MSKNTKKKNAIRFGALAVAALIFLGVFSAWALSTQATATATVGDVAEGGQIDDISTGSVNFEDTIAGRPGDITDGTLFTIEFEDVEEGEDPIADTYEVVVYLADTELDGIRTFAMDFDNTEEALTLENGRIAFEVDFVDGGSVDVDVTGGFYHAYLFQETTENIDFMIDVEPAL